MQSDLEAFIREERIAASQVSLSRWMERLFAEKLSQQKEVLQDIKQLADVLAAQHAPSMYEEPLVSGAGMTAGSGVHLPPRRRWAGLAAGVAAALAAAFGAVLYLQREQDAQVAEDRAGAEAAAMSAAPAQIAPPAPEARGSIEIASTPPGCAIWINGDLRKEMTPARIDNLPLGREIEVKLTKEGLEPYREAVTLTEQAPSRAISKQMAQGSVTVVLKVTPPPTVWLDGTQWKGEGNQIEGVTAGEEHKLVLSADGYAPRTVKFVAKAGDTKVIELQLPKAGAGGGEADPGEPAAAGGGQAKVRVGAKGGFCNVSVNGAALGPTPVEAAVKAGTVRVTCKPPDGKAQSQVVRVAPGDVARVSFKLD
jgi:serine/threonine-protein kinase